MNSRIGINKFMNMGKEAKFVIFAGAALLTAMLLPLIEVYWWGVTLSVSAVVAMLMALYRVRLWVRLLTMPFVLIGVIAATTCAYVVIRGGDTGSADADVDATIFSSRLLARCPLVGSFTQTEEGREAKALFERDGDRLDDMRILPWRSYPDRPRRCEILARLGARFGLIVPLAIIGLHVLIAALCIMATWKLRKGVYRTTAGWVLAILILPWINTLIGSGPTDPNEDTLFVVPDYLPFVNEMPELLLASVVQLGIFAVAVHRGWCRHVKAPGFGIIRVRKGSV